MPHTSFALIKATETEMQGAGGAQQYLPTLGRIFFELI